MVETYSRITSSDFDFLLVGSGDYNGALYLLQDLPLKTCLPKGVTRGCPDCSNCVKVDFRSLQ